ncbi:MAG: GNAT family N-acetyltransferase [Candidatus Altiarchaeota archaeon]|nr:GNAT family N-acetyltransferase [Candidatus Altiarchaeota archaeon]
MVNIRRFKESDATAVAKLSNQNSEFFQFPDVTPLFLQRFVNHPKFQMFVAEDKGVLMGFCGVNFENPEEAELGPICVRKDKRSAGLGKKTVLHTLRFLEPKKPKRVIIKVKVSNTGGQEFFKKLGFKASGNELSCCGEPALLMSRDYGR